MTSSEAERHWNRKIAHSLLLCLNPPSRLYLPTVSLSAFCLCNFLSLRLWKHFFFFAVRDGSEVGTAPEKKRTRTLFNWVTSESEDFAWSHGCLCRVEHLHKTRTSKRRFELYFLIQTAAGHCVCVCARQREVVWGEDTVDNEMFPYSDTVEGTGAECYSPHEQYIVTLLYPAMKKNIHCQETLTVLI